MNPSQIENWEKSLPQVPKPVGSYRPAVLVGNLLFTSGNLPLIEGRLSRTGKVGQDLTTAEGYEEAKTAVRNALSAVRGEIGTLNRVVRIAQLTGYVASAPGFGEQAKVMDGASELLIEVFKERGRPSRVSVGVSELPLNAPVEVALVVEVEAAKI